VVTGMTAVTADASRAANPDHPAATTLSSPSQGTATTFPTQPSAGMALMAAHR